MSKDSKSEPLNPNTLGDPIIYCRKGDDSSIYNLVYITSTYHQNPKEFRIILEKEYNRLRYNGDINSPLKENQKEKIRLENQINNVDLSESKENIIYKKAMLSNNNKEKRTDYILYDKLYMTVLTYAIISVIFQTSYLITLFISFKSHEITQTNDKVLIYIRLLSLIGASVISLKELLHGRRKLNHAIHQKFMYINYKRRIISGLFGIIQIINGGLSQYCFALLLTLKNTTVDCLSSFSVFFMLLNLDDWIGTFLIRSNIQMQSYLRGDGSLVWCFNTKKHYIIKITKVFEYIIYIFIYYGSFKIVLNTIEY